MLYIVIAIIAIVALVLFLLWQKKQRVKEVIASAAGFDLPDAPQFEFTTPLGVYVRSQIRPEIADQQILADAVETGIRQFLDSTADKGWTAFRRHSDFVVWMLEPQGTSSDGFPVLLMRDGTKIAGIAYGVQTIDLPTPIIVIPYAVNFLNYVTAAVRHEAEHIGAWKSGDIAEAERGSVPGHIHPLYRLPNESLYRLIKPDTICGGCVK